MGGLWPCGVLARPHGLRGEIALEPLPGGVGYLDLGDEFFVSRDESPPRAVHLVRVGGSDQRPLLRLDDHGTREEAAQFTGYLLLAGGAALDELPQYVVGDLLGLRVICGERELGHVHDVLQGVVQDVLVIRDGDTEVMVPLVDELVTVLTSQGVVVVREGLL